MIRHLARPVARREAVAEHLRATPCYASLVDSVSQREMRNNSGELLRRVAEGESVLVTNNGVPAAVLVPARSDVRTRLTASGRLRVGTGLDLAALPPPVTAPASTEQLLEEDRGR
jgi:prevent-host-death family protein